MHLEHVEILRLDILNQITYAVPFQQKKWCSFCFKASLYSLTEQKTFTFLQPYCSCLNSLLELLFTADSETGFANAFQNSHCLCWQCLLDHSRKKRVSVNAPAQLSQGNLNLLSPSIVSWLHSFQSLLT